MRLKDYTAAGPGMTAVLDGNQAFLAARALRGARRIERFEYLRREGLLDQDDDEHQEEDPSS